MDCKFYEGRTFVLLLYVQQKKNFVYARGQPYFNQNEWIIYLFCFKFVKKSFKCTTYSTVTNETSRKKTNFIRTTHTSHVPCTNLYKNRKLTQKSTTQSVYSNTYNRFPFKQTAGSIQRWKEKSRWPFPPTGKFTRWAQIRGLQFEWGS